MNESGPAKRARRRTHRLGAGPPGLRDRLRPSLPPGIRPPSQLGRREGSTHARRGTFLFRSTPGHFYSGLTGGKLVPV